MSLSNKTIIITGSSRGIGREIALKCAADGANIVIASKSAEPHPKLAGTIHTVAAEVEAAGGKALPIQLDVRKELDVKKMMEEFQRAREKISLRSILEEKHWNIVKEIYENKNIKCLIGKESN